MLYAAGFRTSDIGTFSVVVGGVASGTATVTPGTYCHVSMSGAEDASAQAYTSFAAAVQTALQAVNAGFTCSFSTTTRRYTIANASNFTLTWTGVSGTNLRDALGFTGNVGSTTSTTGTACPLYLIVPQIDGRSQFTDVYEPDDITEEAVSDGGTDYGVSRDTTELWCDWVQSMETKEAMLTRSASTSAPWTWQDFFSHCRSEHPFAVQDADGEQYAYRLRADGSSFNSRVRERVVVDYDDLWTVRLFTRDLGKLT